MNAEQTGPREWCVDWEVEVDVTLATTVKVGATHIIEADTAEEAVEKVKEDMYVDQSDLDLTQISEDDYEVGDPKMSTFKLGTPVTEWGARS